ncbi:TRAP-type C4-dicarboxylate transport system permease small subunit [Neobacillus niacini]|jgi:TRAP-type transport system small permease protein|uniref:TRAP transporter small permease n=1 Tax=Neobacillus driksii TaxID=3035913 RepID=UPI00278A4A8D|nr:TRAP transporter small permease [Neobacillus niacini]MDQ0976312.1 TRAP-type C4-dicarboxylate transport system permease small subunit [Neobacillus niacini]
MSNFLDKLFKNVDYLLGIMMALMVGFVFLNVVLRAGFNSGLVWSEELARYLFVFITFIGAIGAMRSNSHLGMDVVVRRLPHKGKIVAYFLNQTLILVVMGMLVQGTFKMVVQSVEARAAATGIPISVLYSIMILTAVCIGVNCITNIVKVIKDPNKIDGLVTMHESEEDDIVEQVNSDNNTNSAKKLSI